ncbi:LPS-assembly protein LptD [Zhengella mangrovi]|uniref:LPS-assembly protein LptD n=1 Tax=Zhengella mangrovi TaxID=1982044 RepID=UPI001FE19005|nr:LPS-assembly protein LptD [Zhengella mangrovi]
MPRRGIGRTSLLAARLAGVSLLALSAPLLPGGAPAAFAQTLDQFGAVSSNPDAQMLMEADTLIYDNDNGTVTARGNVQIDYDGYKVVAEKVTYNQATRRVMASGNVEIIERDGNRIYADEIDITDDLGNGFVNALRVETTDNTRFAAESATREGGNVTTFNNGVYTACEPCKEDPGRAPVWQIKARRIVWDGQEKVVRFTDARFEFLGLPIAYLPTYSMADPTVKQKTGFLFPRISNSTALGWGVGTPFNIALDPTYDLLLTPTYYTRQGFLGEVEFRKRFNTGQFTLKAAGISQRNPTAFKSDFVSQAAKTRYMVGTKGKFELNSRWIFGWDLLYQSDKNFSRIYGIGGFDGGVHRSEVYLTGLNDRNYLDLRFMRFQVQENTLKGDARARDERQAWALPSFDYSKTFDEPVAGGQLSLDMNAQSIYRDVTHTGNNLREDQIISNIGVGGITTIPGLAGTSQRLSADLEWKRNIITDNGLVITPLLGLRGDGIFTNYNQATRDAIGDMGVNNGIAVNTRNAWFRYMATAGMELRWPILFSTTSATHVFEPMAQIFVRPNAPYQTALGLPNEDSQALVFDAANLFERDKFAGWDRIEGGTRANLGMRYSGSFANGWTANGLFGQSFHLAGENPYAQPDFVAVGADSGLQSARSDYVGSFGVASPDGFAASVSGRFDKDSFALRRFEARAALIKNYGSISLRYSNIAPQPTYSFPGRREEVAGDVSVKLAEFWRVYGGLTYNLQYDVVSGKRIGFLYDDECFTFGLNFTESKNPAVATAEPTRSFGFRIAFRTLGDFGSSQALNGN